MSRYRVTESEEGFFEALFAAMGLDLTGILAQLQIIASAIVADGDPTAANGMQVMGKAVDGNSYILACNTLGELLVAGSGATPEPAVAISPVAGVPVIGDMETVELDWSDIILSHNLVNAAGNTACDLTYYVRERETEVIKIYPSAIFEDMEVVGNESDEFFLEPRPSGMVIDAIGARFVSVGAGVPVVEVFMRARK